MSISLAVRPLQSSDFSVWSVLWDGYNQFYGRSGADALAPEITRTCWARFFDPDEPVWALVAECDGFLIGFAHYLFHRSTTLIGPTCYLQDLYTVEAARGQGVGRLLVEAVYARAREAGAGRVYWQTHETNLTAMRLYDSVAERSGFLVYRKIL
ncbi:GNAT family N-acetyltransferase [Paludibacterium yongneupense]|uniref:GNAT family N-acetyltransferase n=1 Tax=Paludibacterium yongneupense TaxID=400061 RepID=UPI00040F24E7|nr:GNAT family N-acetyltransferase [Paludibacterium yongneupense]